MSNPQPSPATMRLWGYILDDGTFRPLPMAPMLGAGKGPPPFDVVLPSGEVRRPVDALERVA